MVPKESGIWKWGPVKVIAAPTVPSVRIWAWRQLGSREARAAVRKLARHRKPGLPPV
jgi:hypothetical protein